MGNNDVLKKICFIFTAVAIVLNIYLTAVNFYGKIFLSTFVDETTCVLAIKIIHNKLIIKKIIICLRPISSYDIIFISAICVTPRFITGILTIVSLCDDEKSTSLCVFNLLFLGLLSGILYICWSPKFNDDNIKNIDNAGNNLNDTRRFIPCDDDKSRHNNAIYCKHCGKPISPDSKFCQYCGGNLSDTTLNVSIAEQSDNQSK